MKYLYIKYFKILKNISWRSWTVSTKSLHHCWLVFMGSHFSEKVDRCPHPYYWSYLELITTFNGKSSFLFLCIYGISVHASMFCLCLFTCVSYLTLFFCLFILSYFNFCSCFILFYYFLRCLFFNFFMEGEWEVGRIWGMFGEGNHN